MAATVASLLKRLEEEEKRRAAGDEGLSKRIAALEKVEVPKELPAEEKPVEPPHEEAPSVAPIFQADSLSKLSLQQKAPGRIKIIPAIPGLATTHATAISFECQKPDSLSRTEETESPPAGRAEALIDPDQWPAAMAQDTPLFYRWFWHYPVGYDITSPGFRTSGQWRHDDESGIVVGFYEWLNSAGKLELRWDDINGPTCAVITPGQSYEMLLEAVWSTDASKALQRGFVNGKEVGVKHQTTKGCYAKFGNYKQASIPTTTKLAVGYVVGASRAAVGF